MAKKHLRRHASLLVIREMQIRVTTTSRDFRSATWAAVSKLSIPSADKDPEQLGHARVAGRNAGHRGLTGKESAGFLQSCHPAAPLLGDRNEHVWPKACVQILVAALL